MKVLMAGRQDVISVPGGDTIQMEETKAGLEKLGVDVAVAAADAPQDFSKFDILHVFNLDQLEPLLSTQKPACHQLPPIVLSTIYWHHTGQWFDGAVSAHKSWEFVSKILGAKRSLQFYENWQRFKVRRGKHGRRLAQHLSIPAQLLPNSLIEVNHLQSVLGFRDIPQDKIMVVPNGVKSELYDPKPPPNRSFSEEFGLNNFVLEVARIQKAKNQLGLIEALFDLKIPIVFIGQPSPYEEEYVNCCYSLAKERGNTYFIGSKSQQELAGIYALASVHVLPSWRETPGLASLEAAAAGCRVVSTEVGSAREYFEDLAWYCHPRDPASIRTAVAQAMNAPPSDELRRRVLERYTWDIAARTTLKAYHRALKLN
jgi:glycosyltransferase involved in cell wall biosynthesis